MSQLENNDPQNPGRRSFIRQSTLAGLGLSFHFNPVFTAPFQGRHIGIIGLDTSHSIAFTQLINAPANEGTDGFRVVAAYPKGSPDIESSVSRIPGYTDEIRKMGVTIVDSIEDLLKQADFILLETNDGRPHLEQALPVLESGKPLFIDKPMAASLADAIKIFDSAEKHKTPLFSSSSLRYCPGAQESRKGEGTGEIMGAETYSPLIIEPTHPDLFWYGIHGVELLFTVMQTGCLSVRRLSSSHTDLVTGQWEGDKVGTFRGLKQGFHDYGGVAFGLTGIRHLGPYAGYEPLVNAILRFFSTGEVPVSPDETLEILAFMEAADESKRRGGEWISVKEILQKALNSLG
jgi:hypothetical protein